MSKDIINFSTNWNNKVACNYFTTIRLKNCKKYEIGKTYEIHLQGKFLKHALIEDIKTIKLADVNEFIGGLDTGYSAHETKEIMKRMYGNKVQDINTQPFYFILLKTTK